MQHEQTHKTRLKATRNTLAALSLLLCGSLAAQDNEQMISVSQQEFDATLAAARDAYIAEDYQAAFRNYAKTAQWGDKTSQHIVGQLYARGMGTREDPVAAYAWLLLAAEAPDKNFRRAAKDAAKELNDAQMAQAQAQADQLIANHGLEATGVTCKKAARTGTNIRDTVCEHSRRTVSGDLLLPVNATSLAAAES